MGNLTTDRAGKMATLLGATILMGATPAAAWAQAAPPAPQLSTPTPTVATPANPDQTTAADPATPPQESDTSGDIVVTGFRQSYADAVRAKRSQVSITDGISSDGLGRFPDLNVGEALQRVPGVQINREAEGRNATINLRGLPGEYARLTVNGVAFAEPILTDAAPLGAFNSDIFSAIVIDKSPLANAQSGGLSGNVDLQIAPALSRKTGGFAKAAYEYNTLGKRSAPAVTLGYNYHVSDSFAVFGVLAYKHENFRRDSIQFNSYLSMTPAQAQANAATLGGYYAPSTACPSCTGAVTTAGVIYDAQLRQYSRLNEGNLYAGAGGFEWKPNADTTLGVTGFYTNRKLPKTRQLITITSTNANSGISGVSAPVKLSDGRYVVDDFGFTNPEASNSTRDFAQQQKAWGVNAKGEWKTDDWRLTTIGTVSKSANRSNENQVDFLTLQRSGGNGVTGTIKTGGGNIEDYSYTVSPNPATSTAAPNGWYWGGTADPTFYYDSPVAADRRNRFQLTGSQSYARTNLLASQVDLEHFFDGGPLTGIQAGVRFEQNEYISEGYRTSAFGLQVQNIDSKFLIPSPTAGDFFGGRAGNPSTNWQVTDLDYALDRLRPVTVFPGGQLSPLGYNIRYNDNAYSLYNFTNTTRTAAGYVQAKYEVTIGGIAIRGNGGLRYEYARNTILALDRTKLTNSIGAPSDFTQNRYQNNYGKLLPSFIAIADLSQNLLVRGAAYKTYVRPQPRQFTPSTIVSAPSGGVYAVTLGNPGLKPYDATSLDLSVEWYNRPNSIISLAGFQKRITGLIATVTDPRQLCPTNGAGLGLGTLTLNGDQCQSSMIYTGGGAPVPFVIAATGFVNQPNPVTVRGLEVNFQQSLDFLPGLWKNFGGGFNYAYTNISGKNLNGSPATLPGVSKHNANLIGYYESKIGGIRLVYNRRSAYDLASAGTFTGAARSVKSRGQLDLSASLNVTDTVSLSFDAFNLTDALRLEYENDPKLPRRADYDGRTFALTARTTF